MSKLFNLVNKWFTPNLHSDVERYVASKNPSSAAEIEYWIRQYDYRRTSFFGSNA